jgi:hypothetical protein
MNEPDVAELKRDVQRCIATAKINELENQAYRLGDFVRVRLIGAAAAADILQECALANGLVHEHSDGFVQAIIVDGLHGGVAR